MNDVVILENKHMPLLYNFLVEQSSLKKLDLITEELRLLDNKNVVIAYIQSNKILEAFFIKLNGDTSLTHKWISSDNTFSTKSVKILNSLCALSSRHEPTIVHHIFLIPDEQKYNLTECVKQSNLGKYLTNTITNSTGLCFDIQYPEI